MKRKIWRSLALSGTPSLFQTWANGTPSAFFMTIYSAPTGVVSEREFHAKTLGVGVDSALRIYGSVLVNRHAEQEKIRASKFCGIPTKSIVATSLEVV